MRRVLVTGVSGLGRGALFTEGLRRSIQHYDLGDCMGRIAEERGLLYTESNILRAPSSALTAIRAAAIERLVRQMEQAQSSLPHVVSAHALFMLKDRITEGLGGPDVNILKPDLVITLVDSPQDIHERLKQHTGSYLHLTIETLVRWQEFEVFYSHHLARDRGIPHYVVPVSQPETFLALVQGEKRLIVYASYPMTHLPDEDKPKVEAFVRRLKEHCIVFDPAAVEGPSLAGGSFDPVDAKAIANHTIVRDLDWFIGINAQAVVAYWPKVVFSSGMNDELRYAYDNGRDTYMVAEVTHAGAVPKLSPFTLYKNKLFWSSDDFFDYLVMAPTLQHAYLVMQEEMIALLHQQKETGKPVTEAGFRAHCRSVLRNTLPAPKLKELAGELDALAGRIFSRWAPVAGQL